MRPLGLALAASAVASMWGFAVWLAAPSQLLVLSPAPAHTHARVHTLWVLPVAFDTRCIQQVTQRPSGLPVTSRTDTLMQMGLSGSWCRLIPYQYLTLAPQRFSSSWDLLVPPVNNCQAPWSLQCLPQTCGWSDTWFPSLFCS